MGRSAQVGWNQWADDGEREQAWQPAAEIRIVETWKKGPIESVPFGIAEVWTFDTAEHELHIVQCRYYMIAQYASIQVRKACGQGARSRRCRRSLHLLPVPACDTGAIAGATGRSRAFPRHRQSSQRSRGLENRRLHSPPRLFSERPSRGVRRFRLTARCPVGSGAEPASAAALFPRRPDRGEGAGKRDQIGLPVQPGLLIDAQRVGLDRAGRGAQFLGDPA